MWEAIKNINSDYCISKMYDKNVTGLPLNKYLEKHKQLNRSMNLMKFYMI